MGMSSLPNPITQDFHSPPAPTSGGGVGAKEKEAVSGVQASEFPFAAGAEVELPKEVASAGVTARPTTIPIPQPVSQWVKPMGEHVPVAPQPITSPLTSEELIEGKKKPMDSSWRWLTEWWNRRLKQIQFWRK